jgi:hypothetical protein
LYILRPLIIFSCLLGSISFAKIKSVEISSSSSSYSPKSGALTLEEKLQNNIFNADLSLKEVQFLNNYKASISYSRNVADYSRYLIYDQTATNSVSLGGHLAESNVSIDHVINTDIGIIEIITASNFGTTPLRKSNVSLSYLKKINSTNVFGVTMATQKQNVPQNYFQNPNNSLNPEARVTELDTNSVDINFEHIFTDKYKNRFELSLGQRVQDRPVRYGLNFKNLYVLNDSMAARFDLGYLTESRSDKLKTDLGYQTSTWIETKFLQSINTYFNYGIGYGTEINQEYRPWSNSTEQLGNDQLLLDFNYEASTWNFKFSSALVKYNTGQTGTNMKAGFGWNL